MAATSAASKTSRSRTARPTLAEDVRAPLDAAIADLHRGARTWAALTLEQRARLLDRVRTTTAAAAEDWAAGAAAMKGLDPTHPLRGEEWLAGPYGLLNALDAYAATLRTLSAGLSPLHDVRMRRVPGDRVALRAFPRTRLDALLLSGFTGEVWLRPGVGGDQARRAAGLAQRTPTRMGGIGLVLGAGNVTAIPLLDALYELLAGGRVPLIKLNPTMDGLRSVFERAFAPLVELGIVRFVTGGGEVGAYLTGHDDIAHVHITGSEQTFDAIVWGTGAAATRRRRENRPALRKPITAELGGVSPVIIVPGEWSAADLRFHAEHVATMRLQNSGHNCIAGQVVITSADWPQREAFQTELRRAYSRAPRRPVWYPHAPERVAAAAAELPDAQVLGDGTRVLVELDPETPSAVESTEFFAPVLGTVALPGTGQAFLDAAVAYANERLAGTLGANVLIHPSTQDALGTGFERAIADLRYGCVAINAWTAAAFLLPTLTWGGFPGSTVDAAGSGIGVVHNAYLVDDVERSIVRGPFRPFPRSLGTRERTVLPKPPWFVTARTGAAVSEGLTRFLIDRNPLRLALTFLRAFRA